MPGQGSFAPKAKRPSLLLPKVKVSLQHSFQVLPFTRPTIPLKPREAAFSVYPFTQPWTSCLYLHSLLFLSTGDFMREPPVYEDITDFGTLKKFMMTQQEELTQQPGTAAKKLVLFTDAIQHGAF